jgi:hypothetical protein
VLSNDEPQETGAPVSIEGGAGASADEHSGDNGKTPRFDVQNVLTHELGHFFGLGEDYDDAKATMYVSTRPGETNKRLVSISDGGVMSALYAESASGAPADGSRAGCGGAKLARGNVPGASAWIGFGTAALGLMLLAAARRQRSALRVLPAQIRSRRRSRGIATARFGGWLTVASSLAILSPPRLEAAPAETAGGDALSAHGDAEVQVVGAEPRWSDGIVETELRFRVMNCRVANCPSEEQRVVVAGGKIGGLTQVVGPYAVPEVGARAIVRLRDGHGLLRKLGPTFQSRP